MSDKDQVTQRCQDMIEEYRMKNVAVREHLQLDRQRQLTVYHECLLHYQHRLDSSLLERLRQQLEDELIPGEMRLIDVPFEGIRFELHIKWDVWHQQLLDGLNGQVSPDTFDELQHSFDMLSGYRFKFTSHLVHNHRILTEAFGTAAKRLLSHADFDGAMACLDQALESFLQTNEWLSNAPHPTPPLND